MHCIVCRLDGERDLPLEDVTAAKSGGGQVALTMGVSAEHLFPRDLLAIHSIQSCGHCEFCPEGMPRHGIDIHFMSSAVSTLKAQLALDPAMQSSIASERLERSIRA